MPVCKVFILLFTEL